MPESKKILTRRAFLKYPLQIGGSYLAFSLFNKVFAQIVPHAMWRKKPDVASNMWAWGDNTYGQLGNGNTTSQSSPIQVGSGTWTVAEAGDQHISAIKSGNTLWGVGYNGFGQIGDNSLTNRSSLVQIGAGTTWSSLSSSVTTEGRHTLALKSDGTLWGWGHNFYYQLGTGNTSNTSSPVQIGSDSNWVAISAGNYHSLAVKSNGTLWGWGINLSGELGIYDFGYQQIGALNNWSKVATGVYHTLALKTDGTLWGWGTNSSYQLGNGTTTSTSSPIQIGSSTTWTDITAYSTSAGIDSGTIYIWGYSNQTPTSFSGNTFNSIVMGPASYLATKSNNTLWCWGSNQNAQLGLYENAYQQIGASTDWVKIAVGGSHTLALRTGGALWAWGYNASGAFGNGNTTSRSSPVQIAANSWADIAASNAAGMEYSVGIKTDGTLWSWGYDYYGQLGTGNTSYVSSPTQIGALNTWSKIFTGGATNLAIKTNNTLWGWGENTYGQLGDNSVSIRTSPVQIGALTDWRTVSIGISHTMALKNDWTLWAWGRNTSGEFGDGSTTSQSSPIQIGALTDWREVSAGYNGVSTAIKSDGTLWTWGYGWYGQLGDGFNSNKSSPAQVGALTDWSKVSAGDRHVTAIKTDGTLWVWGDNGYGTLGSSTTTQYSPIQLGSDNTFTKLSVGSVLRTFAIKSTGELYGWGRNESGELGNNTTPYKSSPIQVGALTDWSTKISLGYFHAGAIKTDGTLWMWGQSINGGVGVGSNGLKYSPTQIGVDTTWSKLALGNEHSFATKTDSTLWNWGSGGGSGGGYTPGQFGVSTHWIDVSAGEQHTLLIKSDNTLWALGNNSYGQLGSIGPAATSPVQVGTANNIASLSKGVAYHCYAIDSAGNLYGWGRNTEGQMGNGLMTAKSVPTQIGALTDWTSNISAGYRHTLAVKNDGTLWAWGYNGWGEVGMGTTTNQFSPLQIGAGTNWAKVSAGYNYSLATKTTGTLWAWGNNGSGQFGNSSTTSRSSPVQVGASVNWDKISAGGSHSLAIRTTGTLWAWGSNTSGQFGNGNTTSRSSPVQIGALNTWTEISAGTNFSVGIKTP